MSDKRTVRFRCCYCGNELGVNIKTTHYAGRFLLYHPECWNEAGERADQLTTADVAKLAGITPASVRRYRVRGVLPEPDGMLGSTPWWYRHTITAWLEVRRQPGRPKGGGAA